MSSNCKYNWRVYERASPPKRSATQRIADFREIYSSFDEATVREQASRCLQCPEPQCRTGCPLANHIPEWLELAAEGDFLAAAALSASTSNMPEICSRVCPQERLCEGMCILNGRSEPVAIGAVERFLQEYAFARGAIKGARVCPNGFRAAMVGSGPGSLACADELAKRGYEVTVFESQASPGGLLVHGLPSFKLERSVVERRLKVLRERGIVFRSGVTVGRDLFLWELRRDFNAVFLGIGAQRAKPLDIPGRELKGVFQALPFLAESNRTISPGANSILVRDKHIAVFGGGDTAMDCLRSAIRCGARDAVCLYRRDLDNMPDSRKEYANALEEGAQFQFLVDPVALEGDTDGNVRQVRCVRMELGEPDASGRRKPRSILGSEFLVPADVVVAAFGFDPVPFPPESELSQIALNDWGAIRVDANQMTNVPGVFAGGDAVRGPSLVVHAVRDGRRAALGIDLYLSGKSASKENVKNLEAMQEALP